MSIRWSFVLPPLAVLVSIGVTACAERTGGDAVRETRSAASAEAASDRANPGAAAPADSGEAISAARVTAVAVLAGGCFWCMETQYEGISGVAAVVSGYTGGRTVAPAYEDVGSGRTGHYEAVEIRYDPQVISYAEILDIFWRSVDPTQADGQFCDLGEQYRSAIFFRDSTQLREAEASKKGIADSGVLDGPIATQILPAGPFYPAEEYHQDFWKKNPARYRSYRFGCGRDRRLEQVWGKLAAKPSVH